MTNPPPPPLRPTATPSPSPPANPSPPPRTPRARATPYRPYYRAPLTPSAPPVFGWTPRTPAAPHTPSSARAPPARAAVTPVPVGNACAQPATPAAPQVASPASPAQAATPAMPGAQTPSWLVVGYHPRPPGAAGGGATTVESWCKERIESIKATVDGRSDAVPELRKVMEDLDYAKVADEIAVVGSIRKEFWKARERQRKMVAELHRAEREGRRIESHAAHIDGKIARLRGYARFIERGWTDEPEIDSHSRGKEGGEGDEGMAREDESSGEDDDDSDRKDMQMLRGSEGRHDRRHARSSDVEMQSS